MIRLEHGEPIRFGSDGQLGVVRDPATGGVRGRRRPGRDADVLVHDAHAADPATRSRCPGSPTPACSRTPRSASSGRSSAPTYDDQVREQIDTAGQRHQDDRRGPRRPARRRRHLDRRLSSSLVAGWITVDAVDAAIGLTPDACRSLTPVGETRRGVILGLAA